MVALAYAEDGSDGMAAEKSEISLDQDQGTDNEEPEKDLNKAILKAVVDQLAKNEDEANALAESVDGVGGVDKAESVEASTDSTEINTDIVEAKADTDNIVNDAQQNKTDSRSVAQKDIKVAKSRTAKKKSRAKHKLSEGELLTANYILDSQALASTPQRTQQTGRNTSANSGWVYLGRFYNNAWFTKTLDVNKVLPRVGRNYTVIQALNMRAEPPVRKGTARLVKNLKTDDSVKILKIRRSGTKGHYWAEVELSR